MCQCRLRHGSEVAERDIVQFVPFRDYKNVSVILNCKQVSMEYNNIIPSVSAFQPCSLPLPYIQQSPSTLASAVLAEVPQQLTEYMRKRGILPLTVTS